MKVKGTAIIKKVLKETGNTTFFGYPGGAIMPFYDEIYEDDQITNVLMRHEQSAGHAADGYARSSGKLGVCVTTSGPGATNLVTALANAYYDSSPVLAFSGQVATKLLGTDAFQEAPVIACTAAVTKKNYQVQDINELARTFYEAINIATTGRPGPVFIDLPKDVQLGESLKKVTYIKPENLNAPLPKKLSQKAKHQINSALDLVMNAQYPMILAGGGVNLSLAHKELEEIVNLLRLPVVYTLMGKGVLSDDHPYVLGMLGMHGWKSANFAISEADVILALGTRFNDRITGDLSQFPGQPNVKIIQVDIDPKEIGKNVPIDLPIIADVKLVLQEFLKQLKTRIKNPNGKLVRSWWYKFIHELKETINVPDANNVGKTGKIFPEKIIFELNKIIKPQDIVVTEVGQNQMCAAHYLNMRNPRTWLSSGGLGTMGFGFPAAIGAKVAHPESEVWLCAGDGSFQMNLHELATVKQYNLKINILLLNNQYLGMVRQWQELLFEKRYASTCLACSDGEYYPDFLKLADTYGLDSMRVEKPSEVGNAMQDVLKSDQTCIIETIIEPESNILPMLFPGEAISHHFNRRKERKCLYDTFNPLPRREEDLSNFRIRCPEDEDLSVFIPQETKKVTLGG